MNGMKSVKALMGRVYVSRMPWYLPLGALVLIGIGAAFIRSSHSLALARKHVVFGAIGCAVFLALAFFDYRHLSAGSVLLYALGLLALVGLSFLGVGRSGARRWYDLGMINVQPSEPMKYILVIVLADYFCFRHRLKRFSSLLPPLVLTLLPMGLIAYQPDVGTALLFLPVFFVMAFLAGVRVRHLAVLAAAGCVLLIAGWFIPGVLKPYQKERIIGFVDPAGNPDSAAAYNARQAMSAITAGGALGHGWGQGVLNRLGRVPERHTDFIFPVIAEEWGFVRTAPLVCFYLLMVVLLAQTARRTREPFGRLVVSGVTTLFAFQGLLHIAISLRLAPITGLTLPLVSYGGSSLVSTLAGFGLVASTCLHRSIVFAGDEPGR